jgi:probable HAF family extracellular repeat protein
MARALDEDGTIVGWAENAAGEKRAVLWRDGEIVDLNTLIRAGTNWILQEATDIGFDAAIVGWGTRGGVVHGFNLTPPMDVELSVSFHENEITTNHTNPHQAGARLLLGASVFNRGFFAATGVTIRDTITGPIEYVGWSGGDCVKDGQTLTCTVPPFEFFGRDIMIETRATGPGAITHSARIIASDHVDSNPANDSATETNTAVSLASMTLRETTVTGGLAVPSRVTVTSPAPPGNANVRLTSSRPDLAAIPSPFDVLPGDLVREFYVRTKPVASPVTVAIGATYGLRTVTIPLTIMPAGAAFPYGGAPHAVPGTIQAEDFDGGGQNVGYFDTGRNNDGDAYRNTDVDIQATSDAGGGFNVGWIAPSEWLQYTVDVATAGTYRLDLRVAANGAGGRLHLESNGVDKTGPMLVPNTGGWQTWTTISAPVSLAAGTQRLRFKVDAAGPTGIVGNVNFLRLTPIPPASEPTPFSGTPIALPGIVQAEDFDRGGADVAYRDTTSGNTGRQYRPAEAVDIEATTDTGGGYNVGWMAASEWLTYTVNVANAGSYRLELRVASHGVGGRVHVEFDGVDKTGPMIIPKTGAWQAWTTITAPITLAAGTQRLRVVVDAAGPTDVVGNLNFINIVDQ